MEKNLSSNESELYRRCDEILHNVWDPIGVAGIPEAHDEYAGCVRRVFSFIRDEAPVEEIVEYLLSVEREEMGLEGNEAQARNAVEQLMSCRAAIWKGAF